MNKMYCTYSPTHEGLFSRKKSKGLGVIHIVAEMRRAGAVHGFAYLVAAY